MMITAMTHTHALIRISGFTLIETVAALAICSAVVVALLGVRSRLLQQAARAGQVAAANVVAGQLAAEWRMGILSLPPGERQTGYDEARGMRWELACDHDEVNRGQFMSRLQVRVFVDGASAPTVSIEAWRPLVHGTRS